MSHAARKSVLVVDDSNLMRRLISEIVEADPALRVVDVAENGRVALQKVREHKPDVVLLAFTGSDVSENYRPLSGQPLAPYFVDQGGQFVWDDSSSSFTSA